MHEVMLSKKEEKKLLSLYEAKKTKVAVLWYDYMCVVHVVYRNSSL